MEHDFLLQPVEGSAAGPQRLQKLDEMLRIMRAEYVRVSGRAWQRQGACRRRREGSTRRQPIHSPEAV